MATQRSRECPAFISFSKQDEEAVQVDALDQDISWKGWEKPYCFPPPALVGRVLLKIRQEELKEVILVVLWWPQKPYFAVLMLMVKKVRRLQMEKDISGLVTGPLPREGIRKLRLLVCMVSGHKISQTCQTRREYVLRQPGSLV